MPLAVDEVLESGGQPLDAETRAFMEPRFGHDFSQVRVHADERAAVSAAGVNALAYTVGTGMVFGGGQYTPGTSEGQRLIAHELAHVVQQSEGRAGDVQRQATDEKLAPSATQTAAATPEAADEPGVADLDLAATARSAANKLKKAHPEIVFNSGRRTVADQARAMAHNIVKTGNRNWIQDTYVNDAVHKKLQDWVDANPTKTTQDELAKGLEDTMNAMPESDQQLVSRHIGGKAFDVQPQDKDADKIEADIKALDGLTKFLDEESGVKVWHAQFKLAHRVSRPDDPCELEADRIADAVLSATDPAQVPIEPLAEPHISAAPDTLTRDGADPYPGATPRIIAVTTDTVTVENANGYPEAVPMAVFREAWRPGNPGNPAVWRANSIYQRAWQEILDKSGLPAPVVTPGVSIELAEAPAADTPEERVKLWLVEHASEITAAEARFGVDRRAIAGAIAWEALHNVRASYSMGAARFAGPGKVHYKEGHFSEGNPVAKQVETAGYLPKQTIEGREKLLATPAGAITYTAAIMDAFADEAAKAGYNLRCDPAMLTTFFNGWDLNQARELFKKKKAPDELKPNPDMGTWVAGHLPYLEEAVGKPDPAACVRPATKPREVPESSTTEGVRQKEPILQRQAVGEGRASSVPVSIAEAVSSAGKPLDAYTRAFMEPRFDYDFSKVRVHTNESAAVESAAAVDALAYTVGRDIVFAAGQYAPETSAGQRLIAHELAHVVQQGAAAGTRHSDGLLVSDPADEFERAADATADQVVGGGVVDLGRGASERKAGRAANDPLQAQEQQQVQGDERPAAAPGEPLDTRPRTFVQPHLGHDFARMRVHTGERAAPAAAEGILAYTVSGDNARAGMTRPIQRAVAPPSALTSASSSVLPTSPTTLPGQNSGPYYNLKIGSETFDGLTAEKATRLLWIQYRRIRNHVESGKDAHLEQKKIRDDQWFVGFVSDTLGGVEMPPLDMWDEPRTFLDAAQSALQVNAVQLSIQHLGHAEDAYRRCFERFEEYRGGTISGAKTSVTVLKGAEVAGAVAATIVTGGLAAEAGMGLLATSATLGVVGGTYGAAQETAEQAGARMVDLRKSFDWSAILRRGSMDAITNFVGALAGGALTRYITKSFGAYLSKISSEELAALGQELGLNGPLPRDFFLTTGQRLLAQFLGSTGTAPLTTAVQVVFNRMAGDGRLPSLEQFCDMVVKSMAQAGVVTLLTGSISTLSERPPAGAEETPPKSAGTTPEPPPGSERGSPPRAAGPAANIPEHAGASVERGVFSVTNQTTYLVRAGKAGLYGDHLFTSLPEAEAYAQSLASTGEPTIRSTSALPRVWKGGAEGNPVDAVRVFEVPPGTPNISSVVGPQAEGGKVFGSPMAYPGGGPQVVIDKSVRLGEPVVEVPVGGGPAKPTSTSAENPAMAAGGPASGVESGKRVNTLAPEGAGGAPETTTARIATGGPDRSSAESATGNGGGGERVWVNTKSGIYHREGSPFYGSTREGVYMTEAEAEAQGYRAARGSEAAARGTAEHAMVAKAQRPDEGKLFAGGWRLAKVERTVGGTKRVDELWINDDRKMVFVADTYTGRIEPPAHEAKGWSYANEPEIKAYIDRGYTYDYRAAIKHPDALH